MPITHETSTMVTSNTPIITLLGIVEGEVLEYLEMHEATSLYRLIQAQDWPATLVLMAVGALVRQGLIRGSEERLESVREPVPTPFWG